MSRLASLLLLCLAIVAESGPIPQSLMERVNLSADGPEVSRIALGILHLAQDPKVTSVADVRKVLEFARSKGITTFDLADNYANGKCLEWFGAALQSLEKDHPGWRAGIQVIAKIGEVDNGGYTPGGALPWLDTGRAYTLNITEYYLKVMGTSYLDVLVYHWPDRLMDPQEVAATFKALKDSGKVKYFGVSNFKPLQLKLLSTATEKLGIQIVTNEVAHSPWTPQTEDDGTFEDTQLREIKPLAWGPLGGNPGGGANFLFKVKWPKGSVEAKRQAQIREMLRQVGQELQATEDIVALAWSLRHPAGIVPIIGSMNLTRIALQALQGPEVARRMTKQQWWQISDVCGVGIWGGPVPFVPPSVVATTAIQDSAVAPPCHFLEDDGSCKEATDADSCALDWEKPGTCTASGFPVCCQVNLIEFWFKAGTTCSNLNPGGQPYRSCDRLRNDPPHGPNSTTK